MNKPLFSCLQLLAFSASCVVFSGCRAVAYPEVTRIRGKDGRTAFIEHEHGYEYCSDIATNADAFSQYQLLGAVALTVAAGAAVIAGTAMGPKEDDDTTDTERPNWVEKNRNVLVVSSGGLLALPISVLVARARSASEANRVATRARVLEPDDALKRCLEARAIYVGDRGDVADVVAKQLAEVVKQQNATLREQRELIEEKNAEIERLEEELPADSEPPPQSEGNPE